MTMGPTWLSQLFHKMLLFSGCFKLKETRKFTIYRVSFHLYFVFILLCLCLALVSSTGDFDEFAFNLGAFLCLCTTIVKIFITRSPKYQSLIEEIFNYEEYMFKEAPGSLKKKYYMISNRGTLILLYALLVPTNIVLSSAVAIYLTLRYRPYNSDSRPVMLKFWIPVDPQEHYIVANLYFSGLISALASFVIAVDFTILYPMIYLIVRIKMLKHVLQNPEKFLEEDKEEYDKYYELMAKCIFEHQSIIQTHKSVNDMLKYFFLFDFLLHAMQISGIAFFILKNILNLNNFMYVNFGLGLFIQLFIMYYHGHILFDESQSISTAIYMSNWYSVDIKSRRLMLLMMLRSQRPLGLKIGFIGIVQLEICLKILKTIYTIITVFSEVQP